MLHLAKSILRAAALIAPAMFAADAGRAFASETLEARLLRPSNLALQLHALKDGPAAGVNGVLPLWGRGKTLLLGQAYGFKGDAELGGIGAGLILRHRFAPARMVEANVFIDGLRGRDGFSYPQIGAGLAFSGSWFTARVNGYFPLRDGRDRDAGAREWTQTQAGLDGSVYAIDWSRELFERDSPGRGFDAEFEMHLPDPPRWIDPRLVLGYFYREAEDGSAVHSGPLVRGELHFGAHWSIEGEWRDDAAEIGQEFRIVLQYQHWFGAERPGNGATAAARMDRAMLGPVEREPWPAITAEKRSGKARAGSPRLLLAPEPSPSPATPDDCCPSGASPLIFD